MNWWKDLLKPFLCCLLLMALACKGSSDTTTLKGTIYSTDPAQEISQAPYPNVLVQGKGENAHPVEFEAEESAPTELVFKIKDLPLDETVIFSVSQSGKLDPTLSFPTRIVEDYPLRLAALPFGTVNAIKTAAADGGIPSVPLTGELIGIVSPEGTACAPYRTVTLTDDSGQVVAQASQPLYFDATGAITTTEFSDTFCTYAIINIPAGNYNVGFNGDTATPLQTYPVTILESRTTFGYDIP